MGQHIRVWHDVEDQVDELQGRGGTRRLDGQEGQADVPTRRARARCTLALIQPATAWSAPPAA